MTAERDMSDILDELHRTLAQDHLAVLMSGDASDKDREAARRFLADNHITADVKHSTPLHNLSRALPYGDPELSNGTG